MCGRRIPPCDGGEYKAVDEGVSVGESVGHVRAGTLLTCLPGGGGGRGWSMRWRELVGPPRDPFPPPASDEFPCQPPPCAPVSFQIAISTVKKSTSITKKYKSTCLSNNLCLSLYIAWVPICQGGAETENTHGRKCYDGQWWFLVLDVDCGYYVR